ncbi:MAG: tRNA (adenosine(37)-N6)-dimethylallyltransferase MiaA [Candidatus Moranbacteria bacterium]|nr:tRNA (adenosine(37)-N6)-dimethylallyltransferase MiaA [Candidatus Moranbacteria bacterium]
MNKPKIIVILGPTASGKSDVAIRLAQDFDGEVISADSRQIYRWMDIGSGKITPEEQKMAVHHMLDVADPMEEWSAGKFKREAEKIIEDILSRGKVPIICGGTGFWIQSIVDNVTFPKVKPNKDLRKILEKETTENLFNELKKLDPRRAASVDEHNRPRLVRAIEIATELGSVPEMKSEPKYDALQIALDWPKEKLHERIEIRLNQRFEEGMVQEVQDLHDKHDVTWERLDDFGLEYRWISRFLRGQITEEEMKEKLLQQIKNYAKRQMTWFQRNKEIKWLKEYDDIKKEVGDFLEKNS